MSQGTIIETAANTVYCDGYDPTLDDDILYIKRI